MLSVKPNCECCDVDLPPESKSARICSFECTFCNECASQNFGNLCPNCGGELVNRPVRPKEHLEKNPASLTRFLNQKHSHCSNFASKRTAV